MAIKVGVLSEEAPGERRVALVPGEIGRLQGAGAEVLVEAGAGAGAWLSDEAYSDAGAAIVDRSELATKADVLVAVGRPGLELVGQMRTGQSIIGMLRPLYDSEYVDRCRSQGLTAMSLDGLPRTLTRAQTMDALSSQASIAGYKAVLVAADAYAKYFPLLITAAGTAPPANVLVLGAGVAGLQAIGTARRLGAVVTGYDVRLESRTEVESLGAKFLELSGVDDAGGGGGYARVLSDAERQQQQQQINDHITRQDVVITTAQVPGARPPELVTEDAVIGMRPGSVIVDIASSDLGGNVAISRPEETFVTDNGVTVIGAGNLPSTVAGSASAAYSRNISALLLHLIGDGQLAVDLDDEINAGVVVTYDGEVVHRGVAAAHGLKGMVDER